MKKEIARHAILQLKALSEVFPVISILGPRQVGKTTLASQISGIIRKKIIRFDLELPSDFDKMENAEMILKELVDYCVIIDEIQKRPELFSLLRPLIDMKREPFRFILLGSANPSIIKGVSESLAGRSAYFELAPFSLLEIKKEIPLNTHHFYGGFPLSVMAKTREHALAWLDGFIKSYSEKDLSLLGMNGTPVTIRRLWEMLAWQNGSILNYSSLSKSLSVSHHTVRNYIDFMEGAFLMMRLYPYHYNPGKRIIKSPKIYSCDTGVLHRLLRFQDYNQLTGSHMLGYSWEAYVIAQVKAHKSDDITLYFYRTHAGAEVDMVLVKSLKPIACIEIKYSSTPKIDRGMYNCISDLKTEKNFIVTPSSDDYPAGEKIRVCNIATFLSKYLPEIS